MSPARDQVLNTAELFQLILVALPLNELFRARQISKACRDLIDKSRYMRQIQANPYVGLVLRLPRFCSMSQDPAPNLDVNFTLYHDKPVTVCINVKCVKYPSKDFYKFEDGDFITAEMDFSGGVWSGVECARADRFFDHPYRWTTLYPGVPHKVSWDFRLHMKAGSKPFDGDMGFVDVGKCYIMRLRNDVIGHLIGTKESLLAETAKRVDIHGFLFDKPLDLIAENDVRFTVIA